MPWSIILPSTMAPCGLSVTIPSRLGPPSPCLADQIDPNTHDVLDVLVGMDPIDSQVMTALTVQRGSGAAVREDGIRLWDLKKMLPSLLVDVRGRVNEALQRLIDHGDIRLVSVSEDVYDEANQSAQYSISWINQRALDGSIRTANMVKTA